MNDNLFRDIEQMAFDEATKLVLTQAYVVAVQDSEELTGMYQCKVLPDLIDIPVDEDCPWYPDLHNGRKLDVVVGELVWVYVTSDLAVGFVARKANSIADMDSERAQLWTALKDAVESIDSGESPEMSVSTEFNYESAFYVELHPSVYLFFDRDTGVTGFIDTANESAVIYHKNNLYVRAGEAIVHVDKLGVSGSIELQGTAVIGGGDSPVAKSDPVLDIIDEIEDHIHVGPTGPVEMPMGRDMMPLSAKLIQLKNTLSSTTLEVD